MNKIILALKSRTTWTIVAMFLISGVEGVQAYIPAGAQEPLNGILALLAIYFRVNPKA